VEDEHEGETATDDTNDDWVPWDPSKPAPELSPEQYVEGQQKRQLLEDFMRYEIGKWCRGPSDEFQRCVVTKKQPSLQCLGIGQKYFACTEIGVRRLNGKCPYEFLYLQRALYENRGDINKRFYDLDKCMVDPTLSDTLGIPMPDYRPPWDNVSLVHYGRAAGKRKQ